MDERMACLECPPGGDGIKCMKEDGYYPDDGETWEPGMPWPNQPKEEDE